jgi:ubiquinone/menaquinone biosynthesis C-methylase UbiE
MKLYNKYAEWWPVLSAPADYQEESTLFRKAIKKHKKNIKTALELGCGGGNNASHLKKYYQMTLTDVSPQMLKISKKLNPECSHFLGDMRKIRLNKKFDLVFIHDAVMYMTSENDLRKAFKTAAYHLDQGGMVFVVPDHFKENFKSKISHGGHDDPATGRSLRYLEWDYDGNPKDSKTETVFTYIFMERNKPVRVARDLSITGIFPKKTWERLLKEAGFRVHFEVLEHSELDKGAYIGIVGIKQ